LWISTHTTWITAMAVPPFACDKETHSGPTGPIPCPSQIVTFYSKVQGRKNLAMTASDSSGGVIYNVVVKFRRRAWCQGVVGLDGLVETEDHKPEQPTMQVEKDFTFGGPTQSASLSSGQALRDDVWCLPAGLHHCAASHLLVARFSMPCLLLVVAHSFGNPKPTRFSNVLNTHQTSMFCE
jgi:hypothetical protein